MKKSRKILLEKELMRVVNILKKDKTIKKIFLFGSLSNGEINDASDVDIIVVQDTKARFLDRLDALYRTIVPNVGMDILVYTPEEFNIMKEKSFFLRYALATGRMIYAA